MALKTLNKLEFKKIRDIKTVLLDSTAILIDLKFNGKFISKQTCLDKDYKRGFSTSIRPLCRLPDDNGSRI